MFCFSPLKSLKEMTKTRITRVTTKEMRSWKHNNQRGVNILMTIGLSLSLLSLLLVGPAFVAAHSARKSSSTVTSMILSNNHEILPLSFVPLDSTTGISSILLSSSSTSSRRNHNKNNQRRRQQQRQQRSIAFLTRKITTNFPPRGGAFSGYNSGGGGGTGGNDGYPNDDDDDDDYYYSNGRGDYGRDDFDDRGADSWVR
jgi:hypothetical protein